MKPLKQQTFRDFSKGTWCSAQNNMSPENSTRLGLNLDSDVELGSLLTRDGTTLLESQLASGKSCYGLHNYRYSASGGLDKVFASFPDATSANNDIYDLKAGTVSLADDTVNLRTHFLTYLDSCLRLNGTDDAKAWNSSAWITTGGAFDLADFPIGAKYAVEFKDRVYTAGMSATPDRVDISSIANSGSRTISWDSDDGAEYILFEQEDGGGGITGLAKVPGYVLVFKKRTLKRYDGASAYPEDMTNQGAPSQEAIVTCSGMCFWVNENGAWVTSGGTPKKISSFNVDPIIKSCSAANLVNIVAGEDGEHIFWSFPSVTIYGSTYTNIVLKYSILLNTWDVRQYSDQITEFERYVDANEEIHTIFGDDDGNVQILDSGDTDNSVAISYSLETQDWDFGQRMFNKRITRMGIITENISKGTLMWRNNHKDDSWKKVGTIDNSVQEFSGLNLQGNFFNFKITETVTTGKAKILGFEFPGGGVVAYDNV